MLLDNNLLNGKWLLLGVYKPSIQSDSEFAEEIVRTLNHYIPSCENILLLGDLNMTTENLHLNNLMEIFNLNVLIKTTTWYQSHNPTCIDNILTNQKALFKLSKALEARLSDHHKLISTIIKSGSFKGFPRKNFIDRITVLILIFLKIALQGKLKHLENDAYSAFISASTILLNEHAPLKTRTSRYNNKDFITKEKS